MTTKTVSPTHARAVFEELPAEGVSILESEWRRRARRVLWDKGGPYISRVCNWLINGDFVDTAGAKSVKRGPRAADLLANTTYDNSKRV